MKVRAVAKARTGMKGISQEQAPKNIGGARNIFF